MLRALLLYGVPAVMPACCPFSGQHCFGSAEYFKICCVDLGGEVKIIFLLVTFDLFRRWLFRRWLRVQQVVVCDFRTFPGRTTGLSPPALGERPSIAGATCEGHYKQVRLLTVPFVVKCCFRQELSPVFCPNIHGGPWFGVTYTGSGTPPTPRRPRLDAETTCLARQQQQPPLPPVPSRFAGHRRVVLPERGRPGHRRRGRDCEGVGHRKRSPPRGRPVPGVGRLPPRVPGGPGGVDAEPGPRGGRRYGSGHRGRREPAAQGM